MTQFEQRTPLATILFNYLAILIDRAPKIVLLALDLYKNLINEEGVTVTLMAAP